MNAVLSLRRAQGRLLLAPSARTVRWVSFAVISATGALVVWSGGHDGGNPATVALPVATTLLCVWLCFLFEDAAAETTAASATPLLYRRAVRASIAVPSAVVVWFAYTWIGVLSGPTAILAGSFAAMIMLTLASSAVAVRIAGTGSGSIVAATAVVFMVLVWPVAIKQPPSVDPTHPPFGSPLTYWSAVALVSGVVLALAHHDRFQRR